MSTKDLFFELVRSGIGMASAQSGGGRVVLSSSQWERLYAMSTEQMLGAVVLDELTRRGHNMPQALLSQWRSYVSFGRERFDAQLMALTHLTQVLEDNGIRLMVLKGLGLSLLYPVPQNRECCDIDIYCFADYDRVNDLLLEKGLIRELDDDNGKHCGFIFDGINVENHRYFCELVNDANVIVNDRLVELSGDGFITDTRVPGMIFPGSEMGLHQLMMHTLSHLAWSGIRVRHLVDCCLYLKRFSSDLDWTSVTDLWKRAGIYNGAICIIDICQHDLGLDLGLEPELGHEPNAVRPSSADSHPVDALPSPGPQTSVTSVATPSRNLRPDASAAAPSRDLQPDASAAAPSRDLHQEAAFVLYCTLRPFGGSTQVWDPARKFFRKLRQYIVRRRLHKLVYGTAFPDSFWKSFSFLRG